MKVHSSHYTGHFQEYSFKPPSCGFQFSKKIHSVTQKALENLSDLKTHTQNLLKKIIVWLRSAFLRISNCFSQHIKLSRTKGSLNETQSSNSKLKELHIKNLAEFHENPERYLKNIELNLIILKERLSLFEIHSTEDVIKFNQLKKKTQEFDSKIKTLGDPEVPAEFQEKIALYKESFLGLQEILAQQVKQNAVWLLFFKESPKLPTDQSLSEPLNPQLTPPHLKHGDLYINNCWLHSSAQLLRAMGKDFVDLVNKKESSIHKEREKKWTALTQNPKGSEEIHLYYQKRAEALAQVDLLENYLNQYNAHHQVAKKIEKDYLEASHVYEKNLAKFENEQREWEEYSRLLNVWKSSDQTTPMPVQPLKKSPEKPEKPTKPPLQEFQEVYPSPLETPEKPAHLHSLYSNIMSENECRFFSALKKISAAIQTGNHHSFIQAVKSLEKILPLVNDNFPLKVQNDATECIQFILQFLSPPLFYTATKRVGLEDSIFKNKIQEATDPHNCLILDLQEGPSNFQELLNHYFAEKKIDDPENGVFVDGVRMTQYVEKTRFIQPKESTNSVSPTTETASEPILIPPDFIMIMLKRFNHEQVGQDSHDYKLTKNTSSLKLPESQKINLGVPFGSHSSDPYLEYELHSCIIHQGASKDRGHYIATVLHANQNQEKQWYSADNAHSKVEQVSNQAAQKINEQGYFYYFKRVLRKNST